MKSKIIKFEEKDKIQIEGELTKITNIDINILKEHIKSIKEASKFKAFFAYDDKNNILGIVCANICTGPFPLIPKALKFGNIWGFTGDKILIKKLMRKAINYLSSIGVNKILTYTSNSDYLQMLNSLGFNQSNLLVYDRIVNKEDKDKESKPIEEVENCIIKYLNSEYDEVVYEHWVKMWEENGLNSFIDKNKEITLNFIKESRETKNYVTIGAFYKDKLVGTCSTNIYYGCEPNNNKVGSAWAIYVDKEFRRKGIGTRMTREMKKYLLSIGCNQIRLIYASQEGKRIYLREGFMPQNFVALDSENIQKIFDPFIVSGTEISEDFFEFAIQAQLNAVGSNKISRFSGKLFENKSKNMGKGFKLDELKEKKLIAEKFNKLSKNWEESIIGMKYEYVFEWLVMQYKKLNENNLNNLNENSIILDMCCGVGLMGQTIRMLGYKGLLYGCDISTGMLSKAFQRGCYNELFIQDANENIKMFNNSIDAIILLGSIELLNIDNAISNCANILKKNGILFVSFQWDNGKDNPTSHQNIFGVKENDAINYLKKYGFVIDGDIIKCENAFLTPKPTEDGSILVPVPYLFIKAIKNL